jgi:hypothetical protein
LGATLTFCIQVYSNHVQDERTARQSRAQHIERAMTAGRNIDAASIHFKVKLANAAAKLKDSGTSNLDFQNYLVDNAPVTELRAVSALYLPEVQQEADRLAQAYDHYCQELLSTYPSELVNYKGGELRPNAYPELRKEITQAAMALEQKLIELAKQNRQ